MPRTRSTTELAYDDDLARGFRRARLAAGIGLREAANLADLDLTSVWRIENGSIVPLLSTIQTLVKLYKANLNVGPDGLMLTWMEAPAENDEEVAVPTKGGT